MKQIISLAGALLLLASTAHALSVDGPMEVMSSIESPSSDFWDDPEWTTSPDFIIAPHLHYLSEVVQVWQSNGFGMVAFNNAGLVETDVGAYFSHDYGQTWQSHESLLKTVRGGDVFDWSSDPQATTYLDNRGRTRFAFGAVGLTRLFSADGFRNCASPSAMVVATTLDSVRWSVLHLLPSPGSDTVLEDRPMLVGDGHDLWAMYNAVGNNTVLNTLGCDDETAQLWFTRSSDGGVTWTPLVSPHTIWNYIDGNHPHMAPQNIIVDHGKLLFAFFDESKNIRVFRCAVDGMCEILQGGGIGFNPSPTDHFFPAGLPSTRTNSDPAIACNATRQQCIVAWMDVDPLTPTDARVRVMSTQDNGATWSHPPLTLPRGATQGSQILPAASWGAKNAMLCWYQQLGLFPDPASGSLDFVCMSSADGGRTWREPAPVRIGHVDIGNERSIGTHFAGDYNQCDGIHRKCVFTGNLQEMPWGSPPPPTGHWRARPIVQIATFNPDSGCAITPHGGSGGAWLMIAPLLWLVRRRAAVVALAVLLAAPVHAACMGDCNADGEVRIDEVITLVNVALENTSVDACPVAVECDDTGLGVYGIYCLVQSVGAALDGCPVEP